MVIIDGSVLKNLIVYGKFSKGDILKDPKSFYHLFLNQIVQMIDQFNVHQSNKMVIAVDSKTKIKCNGTRNYWREVYYHRFAKDIMILNKEGNIKFPHYKIRPPKDDGVDWDTINKCYSELLVILKEHTDVIVVKRGGIEADEICAVIAQYVDAGTIKSNQESNDQEENVIFTNDKDMVQVISAYTTLYNPYQGGYIAEGCTEKEKTIFFLTGDTTDCVPSCKAGYAKKTWDKVYNDDLMTMFNNIPVTKAKPREDPDLLMKRYEFNRKVMDISIESLPPKITKMIYDEFTKPQPTYNMRTLSRELRKLRLGLYVEEGCQSIFDRKEKFEFRKKSTRQSIAEKKEKMEEFKGNRIADRFGVE